MLELKEQGEKKKEPTSLCCCSLNEVRCSPTQTCACTHKQEKMKCVFFQATLV
ncbi:hypothetical protein ACSBR2_027939 [Camellia fascicularis]